MKVNEFTCRNVKLIFQTTHSVNLYIAADSPVRWCCGSTHSTSCPDSGLAWIWHRRPLVTQHLATAYTPLPPGPLWAAHSTCPSRTCQHKLKGFQTVDSDRGGLKQQLELTVMVSPAWTPSGLKLLQLSISSPARQRLTALSVLVTPDLSDHTDLQRSSPSAHPHRGTECELLLLQMLCVYKKCVTYSAGCQVSWPPPGSE